MFISFFYLLRQRGLNISLNEWLTLLEGMEKGLHNSTLTGLQDHAKGGLSAGKPEDPQYAGERQSHHRSQTRSENALAPCPDKERIQDDICDAACR